MTTQEALKAQVQYPLPANFFASIMVKRGLAGDGECTKEIMESSEFKGAMADCIKQIILYPSSISEGGMSISKADKNDLLFIANRLYREIGEEPISERPKVTFY
jgi:hypothetical protein